MYSRRAAARRRGHCENVADAAPSTRKKGCRSHARRLCRIDRGNRPLVYSIHALDLRRENLDAHHGFRTPSRIVPVSCRMCGRRLGRYAAVRALRHRRAREPGCDRADRQASLRRRFLPDRRRGRAPPHPSRDLPREVPRRRVPPRPRAGRRLRAGDPRVPPLDRPAQPHRCRPGDRVRHRLGGESRRGHLHGDGNRRVGAVRALLRARAPHHGSRRRSVGAALGGRRPLGRRSRRALRLARRGRASTPSTRSIWPFPPSASPAARSAPSSSPSTTGATGFPCRRPSSPTSASTAAR